jgi:hypothetical protein
MVLFINQIPRLDSYAAGTMLATSVIALTGKSTIGGLDRQIQLAPFPGHSREIRFAWPNRCDRYNRQRQEPPPPSIGFESGGAKKRETSTRVEMRGRDSSAPITCGDR